MYVKLSLHAFAAHRKVNRSGAADFTNTLKLVAL